jgi:hypothetical protein
MPEDNSSSNVSANRNSNRSSNNNAAVGGASCLPKMKARGSRKGARGASCTGLKMVHESQRNPMQVKLKETLLRQREYWESEFNTTFDLWQGKTSTLHDRVSRRAQEFAVRIVNCQTKASVVCHLRS